MDKNEIIKNIALRTGGDIYLGVVGAVRTGKSTFIKKVVENLIVPNIEDEYERKRALDEVPQSAAGKTIMTTEPKFIPATAAKIQVDDFTTNIKMIDCVGYVINAAKGYEDENGPRLVMTPWYSEPIPFVEAAEIGTEKVIKDHSTIGIVVTTDGSIGEIPRNEYLEAEETVITELKNIGKPYIVLLNSTHPMMPDTEKLADDMKDKYGVPVLPVNIEQMQERDMYNILKEALFEFPVNEVKVNMPEWIAILNSKNPIKQSYINSIKESISAVESVCKVIANKPKAELGDALKALIAEGYPIQGALKTGILALYGYTCEAGGIRHAERETESTVTFEEAKFMMVTCSAIVNYLVAEYGKHGAENA